MTQPRSARLTKFFYLVVSGKRPVSNIDDFKKFLEAILHEEDHAACVERIIASSPARSAIHSGLRFDTSPEFINAHTSHFLLYLATPAIKNLCNGRFLRELLMLTMEPRTVQDAFMQAFNSRRLNEDSVRALAWVIEEVLSLPTSSDIQLDITDDAQKVVADGSLFESPSREIRTHAYKIKHLLQMKTVKLTSSADPDFCAGGRHDNDFADYRKIAIYPTSDEFLSTTKPFYRRAQEIAEVAVETRLTAHLDNQFRLLREDMLSDIRDGFQIARGQKKGRQAIPLLRELTLTQIRYGDGRRLRPCTLIVSCASGLGTLTKRSPQERKEFLKEHRNYLRHQAFGCLMRQGEIISFCTLDRDVELLSRSPAQITLRIIGQNALSKTLLYFKLFRDIEYLLVDASVFAYEPILLCLQDKLEVSLAKELLEFRKGDPVSMADVVSPSVIEDFRQTGNNNGNIQSKLKTEKEIRLDSAQLESFLSGLSQSVSLIQGPPGTGKSFVGALLAKAIYTYSKEKILVMCYTNHALDQFLEDLLDIGIDQSEIVRLGSKSTNRTSQLNIHELKSDYRRSQNSWGVINKLNADADELKAAVPSAFQKYQEFRLSPGVIDEFLEFEHPDFYEAFRPPEDGNEMTMVGKKGRDVTWGYLFEQWSSGRDHGLPSLDHLCQAARDVWEMVPITRQSHIQKWTKALIEEQVTVLQRLMCRLDNCRDPLDDVWNDRTRTIISSKRIIGCTTTAASMNTAALGLASPGVILLEEAGEILEPHVLAAMGPHTKQLILIGDHQQLRPKINNYGLSVENGAGYDLNRSLFERLVGSGHPHSTLAIQHRMCPEISSLVQALTYPGLLNDPKTLNRPGPRGLQDRVIFINHNNPEKRFEDIADRRDEGAKVSKRNIFEAEMVLKIVRYLGQQGYGTDKIVVLTPYLGQLHLLRDYLRKDNDPVLNDLDSHDLVRAGLLSQASARHTKRPIRLSTIDNYQGEESDIVVATLTRSNDEGDIGFMAAQQRLNVLLSRARNILIMIGNARTFTSSRKGKNVWGPFIDQLHAKHHLYDGLPIKCEQHPQHTTVIYRPQDFDTESPDGGCRLPCGAKLNCGIHDCPYMCHQLSDHSKMKCLKIVEWRCPRNHRITRPCSQLQNTCQMCNAEDKAKERRREQEMDLEIKRERMQTEYLRQLTEIQEEIAHERRARKDKSDAEEKQRVLQQHKDELERLRSNTSKTHVPAPDNDRQSVNGADCSHSGPSDHCLVDRHVDKAPIKCADEREMHDNIPSAAADWKQQKEFEGAQSPEIDALMEMIGLESVKEQFLDIKAQVDTASRQNIDLQGERFGSVLLGNPGTGKTTVAGLYAKFLTSMGVIPGSFVVETTGSRLANDGVTGCEKQINNIISNGGGVLFIDEAYQLSQGHGSGSQVIDFLVGEKFFAHNPGLPSRFPREFSFEDYDDDELRRILEHRIRKKYSGRMTVEGGMDGLYCRIVARRLGRQRGKEGFANARAVANACSRIFERQARRLKRERRRKTSVDDLYLTREDLIGPEPSNALQNCFAWQKLQSMIGLKSVKEDVQALLDSIQSNYNRELSEQPLVEFTLNRVLLGSPGTGKTTVAKLYGQILVDIGYLSNGQVIVKNPSDFVGSVLGESERNTKGILASTIGKVLVIDEAYGLYGGHVTDIFKTAVIDTIVAEVQSTPGDDRCVLLLGYQDQMTTMFQKVNPGLSRRFPLDAAFVFEDFTDHELGLILDLTLKQQGFETTPTGRKVALEVLARARNHPHFGNAGEIDILLNTAKINHQRRLATVSEPANSSRLESEDFDKDFDRADRSETDIPKLFSGVVGCEKIVQQLEGYRQTVKNMRELEMEPRDQVPFNFLFKGPPGTGKTSTARRMGEVYYNMGLLSSAEVIESSATDLIGQYIGHTGPKTQSLLEKALGKVLLIDEAYRLAEGHFAKEAMDEIVDCITKPKFFRKLIIILAGYDTDINRLMAINPGLTSRFPESVEFNGLSPDSCMQLLTNLLQTRKNALASKLTEFDMTSIESPSSSFQGLCKNRFARLSKISNWANARDVQTLANRIFQKAVQNIQGRKLLIEEALVITEMDHMIQERTNRESAQSVCRDPLAYLQTQAMSTDLTGPPTNTTTTTATTSSTTPKTPIDSKTPPQSPQPSQDPNTRDPGVPDAIWTQLQKDKLASEAREKEHQKLISDQTHLQNLLDALKKQQQQLPPLTQTGNDDNDGNDEGEAKKRHEQARLQHELERRAREDELETLRKKREAAEQERKKEQQAQKRLRQMGVCCMGFRWIRQASGYRCAGGVAFCGE
ncbi:putative AAA family ATPase [Aspergillus ibericus CBS 121593]|uniref:Putative AAA family ATPase n=1 Tax=Aspergillus ibericus CBS 121593 TaxID=1448316 RepID=A0A395H4F0_9EURO|nr:putative AAA family ATPase [Aspergillus ibericus CBS 121593]RAL01738.1 putative AAA family ATPase [Aspergillus ibericus CBS 121593]